MAVWEKVGRGSDLGCLHVGWVVDSGHPVSTVLRLDWFNVMISDVSGRGQRWVPDEMHEYPRSLMALHLMVSWQGQRQEVGLMRESAPVHVALRLAAAVAGVGPYPARVREVESEQRIRGTAFFPAGFGLWDPDGVMPVLPPRPVVVVGHNFGTVKDFKWAKSRGCEYSELWPERERRGCPTWWNLLTILRGAGVGPEECFFTNALMGLKDDGGGNVGTLTTDQEFLSRCRGFLRLQLRELKPRVVVVIGKPAISTMGREFEALRGWLGPRGGERTLPEIKRRGHACVEGVSVGAGVPPMVAVAIAHPCDSRNLSKGFVDEVALLRTAFDAA